VCPRDYDVDASQTKFQAIPRLICTYGSPSPVGQKLYEKSTFALSRQSL
jgi:hypothetical protein